ncbi:MAG TPA: hypothetical protein ENN21_09240 [Spirochaetes bacterium]|nr:hypothetical protein [Spirochaetota bacterium]
MTRLAHIKEKLLENPYAAKFLCLLAAVILWAYVGSTKLGEVKFRVPVELKNLPASMIITDGQEHFVSVVLNGKKESISNLNVKNLKAFVDLEKSEPGERVKFPIEIVKSDIPEQIRIDISPQKLYLSIDRKVLRRIRVQPTLTGELREGHIMGVVRVEPETVAVTGPEGVVSNINAVETMEISVAGLTRRTVRETVIDAARLNNCVVDNPKVTVYIPVIATRGLQKMTLDIKGVRGSDKYSYSLLEETVTVYVRPANEGETIEAGDIEAVVDFSAFDPDTYFTDDTKETMVRVFTINTVIRNRGEDFTVSLIQPELVPVKIMRKPAVKKP